MPKPSTLIRGTDTTAYSPLLVSAASACSVLWLSAAVALFGIHGTALISMGAGGAVVTAVVLLLVQHHHASLRGLADTDALTGLANHRGFHELLASQLERAERDRLPLALVMLDLDNFKVVNDTHGHPYGDEVLRAVGHKLQGVTRSTDTAARTGGEEFALILPGLDGRDAYVLAERARKAIGNVPVHGLELTCSAGVAVYPGDAEDASSLCQLADSALYWAKHGGKRRTRRFDPEYVPASWSDSQGAEIEALLAEDEPVQPVYQPVVTLATGRLVGYEALARFPRHPNRSPDVIFAQAHGCGLGPELEAAAIRAALEPLGRPPGTHLAINVSPSALSSDPVQRALPSDLTELVIEITEHELIPDDEDLASALADVRARGAQVAIDDAGAGHAGLKQLMRLRPDIVKLDRALIADLHADAARMALVESFVRFARDVGATVCAEGVESLDELAVLADLDVQWGQGYVLAPPSAPWPEPSPVAAEVCRAALAEALREVPAERSAIGASDRRLVHLSARLAGARSREDLCDALEPIAAELGASKVVLSRWYPEEGTIDTLAESGEASGQTRFAIADYPLSAHVLLRNEAVQVVVGDPNSDPAEVELLLSMGKRSLLMVPVISGGEACGLLEAYSPEDRPWTRAEINRARVIANQLASLIRTLAHVEAPSPAPASDGASPRRERARALRS